MSERAVVIGGGISGLATAALLARDGFQVTLLEARPELGGRAGLWEEAGFRFDTGPSWYLMPEVFDHFFKLMGTSAAEQLDLTLLEPGYRVIFEPDASDPKPSVDISSTREGNIAVFEAIEPGAGKRLGKYLDSAEDTYDIAKRRFLYSTFADFRPLLTGDVLSRTPKLVARLLQPLSKFVAARFKDERLQQILGYPAVFLGSSPFVTPSMYHLMSHLDLQDGVLYPQGGLTTVIEAIERVAVAAGVTIIRSASATEIVTKPIGGATPSVIGVRYTTADGQSALAAAGTVVSAADLHFSETELLPPALQTYPEKWWVNKIPGPSALLIYLGVKGSLPELAHHSLLFVNDWEESFSAIVPVSRAERRGARKPLPSPLSLYICKPSATDPSVAPEGFENLFVLVPLPADPSLGAGGVWGGGDETIEKLADDVLDQISDWAKIPDLKERIVVRRTVGPADFANDLNSWRGTALGPAHILSQSAFFRAGNISKRVTGLYYAGGSTIPGIGLPMCLISAELIVKRIRGDVSTGPLPEPLSPRLRSNG